MGVSEFLTLIKISTRAPYFPHLLQNFQGIEGRKFEELGSSKNIIDFKFEHYEMRTRCDYLALAICYFQNSYYAYCLGVFH